MILLSAALLFSVLPGISRAAGQRGSELSGVSLNRFFADLNVDRFRGVTLEGVEMQHLLSQLKEIDFRGRLGLSLSEPFRDALDRGDEEALLRRIASEAASARRDAQALLAAGLDRLYPDRIQDMAERRIYLLAPTQQREISAAYRRTVRSEPLQQRLQEYARGLGLKIAADRIPQPIDEEEAKGIRDTAYGDMAAIWRDAGQFAAAKTLLRRIKENDKRLMGYASLAVAEHKAGLDPSESLEAAETAKEGVENHFQYKQPHYFVELSRAIAQAGRDPRASIASNKEWAGQLRKPAQAEHFRHIAELELELGFATDADETAHRIDHPLHQAHFLLARALHEHREGRWSEALFERARTLVEGIQPRPEKSWELSEKIDGYSYLADAAAQLGADSSPFFNQAGDFIASTEQKERDRLYAALSYERGNHGLWRDAAETIRLIQNEEARAGAISDWVQQRIEASPGKGPSLEQIDDMLGEFGDPRARSLAPWKVFPALLKKGRLEEARSIALKTPYPDWSVVTLVQAHLQRRQFEAAREAIGLIADPGFKLWALSLIAAAQGAAALRDSLTALYPAEIAPLFRYAVAARDEKLVIGLGALVEPRRQEAFLNELPRSIARWGARLLDFGRTSLVDVRGEEATAIFHRTFHELRRLWESAPRPARQADEPFRRQFRWTARTLVNLGSEKAKAALLELLRKALSERPSILFPRLLHAVIEGDTLKGNDHAVTLLGDEATAPHLAWLVLGKLGRQGYLDPSLVSYLRKSRPAAASREARLSMEAQDLQLVRLIIRRLGINPDGDVVRLVRDHQWRDDAGRIIDARKEPEAIIDRIERLKAEFERIEDRDELARTLAADKLKATAFYVLHAGSVHYSLVNSYTAKKFHWVLGLVDQLRYHPGPEAEFEQALIERGTDSGETREILARLRAGRFPLRGERAWSLRLDVSRAGRLEALEREARGLLGSDQLGALLKRVEYQRILEESGRAEAARRLDSVSGLGALAESVGHIERDYPDLAAQAELRLAHPWRKIGAKGGLTGALHSTLGERDVPIDLDAIAASLELYRKELAFSVRQQFKARSIERMARDERLELIDGKSQGRLLRFLVEDAVGGESLPEAARRLFVEWESHLEGVFQRLAELRKMAGSLRGPEQRSVTLRYLDKREDFIASLRFADSAQCCFNSQHYRIENQNAGSADWIARLWKDPLSFVFMIEDNAPGDAKREAIGFVFGSFGLNEGGAPIALLNGVYLQSGKTDAAVHVILDEIERRFSRLLGLAEQVVAARHGGSARLGPEYSNAGRELRRLRALANTQDPEGKPETKVYDDIGLENTVNESGKSDGSLWHKSL